MMFSLIVKVNAVTVVVVVAEVARVVDAVHALVADVLVEATSVVVLSKIY